MGYALFFRAGSANNARNVNTDGTLNRNNAYNGNNGLRRVQGNGSGRILVIKDSYANCFVPYLTANYADIDVVDFRNYNYGLDQLIADNGYDQILVLYTFDSFKSDPYLYRAGVQG